MISDTERSALRRALELAADPAVPLGPNPRVGCVLLDADGKILAEGRHRGAGTAHAEADALARADRAGHSPAGATAVVTLEPCTHRGRTPPCAEALLRAGVRRVVIARRDPNPVAAGGLEHLAEAGVEIALLDEDPDAPEDLTAAAAALNRGWEHGLRHGRPLVTAKVALSLDGRAAAADGSSRWITGPAAREEVHLLRATCDTVLVGTGTARADRPALTARRPDGTLHARQPLRAVMGTGSVPLLPAAEGAGEMLALATRSPTSALEALYDRGQRHVLLEGGPTLLAAFLRAALVDELIVHLAPTLLGSGPAGIGELGITTIAERLDLELVRTVPLTSPDGRTDLSLTLRPRAVPSGRTTMFTGIIEELGTIESLTHHDSAATLQIRSPHVLEGISLGDSIAVDGCCLTVTAHDGKTWSADVIATTLAATTLGRRRPGDRVNLERAVRADARLDGHIVQGHVDGVGEVLAREEDEGTTLLRIALPEDAAGGSFERYVVDKGSLAVDGVSLTAVAVEDGVVSIGLIPETLARTTLGRRAVGEGVNLEVDILAKHVEKLLGGRGGQR
ncbi:bifunctional diaminohydroxyphosphoribosylaminopyrimidine deaminase/5-amino-6-(5-phosphoribosylamino)uracil reductase RibD [Brachybacterium sp. YJGR34]|uniref:bifunctional diaminohydroxyphosphoribosylaminopyrimidine deaminase/5-amino-6-(5-phosphoribosylamino)uracil reductase RibD n=1 Tax=Brachybacterium sp. YJGR34 TaxID=2059911 RepID=UPI001E600B56|nr:bifunctional diaminohydroxyphosphoribosylaminopyrimidine deaminase/5-amino-6-(5-phosphoribosylamino)uracil reductase RibD [Brachybacterium sp. YJGR34]